MGSSILQLDSSAPQQEVIITNDGPAGSILHWRASDDSPLVHVSPAQGKLPAGEEQALRVSVDFSGLQLGASAGGTVTVDSNGGSGSLQIHFIMNAARACHSTVEVGLSSFEGRPQSAGFVPGELLVGFNEPIHTLGLDSVDVEEEVLSDYGLMSLSRSGGSPVSRVEAADPEAAARELGADPRVAFAHPNYYLHTLAVPNDPCYFDQWNLQEFGLPEAWDQAGSERVIVAIIDTGVDTEHEDLAQKMLPGFDFFDDDNDPNPGYPNAYASHGTHVAGIALAQGDNGIGIAGVAHMSNVQLLPVKIFDDSGLEATTADLVDAILWSAGLEVPGTPRNENPADIINMSVGAGARRIAAIDLAAERAAKAGSLLIAAAGNNNSRDGEQGIQSPANSPSVLAVGSIDSDLGRSEFSDWGDRRPTVDLMAPGGYGPSSCRRVRSTIPWSNYGCMAGTSMAAPFVAGVAALVLATEPDLDSFELSKRLTASAYLDPSTMDRDEYGNGILCASRALSGAKAPPTQPCG